MDEAWATEGNSSTCPVDTVGDQRSEDDVTALQDFIAGGIAGSASVIVGHPFDTIKVSLSTLLLFTAAVSTANEISAVPCTLGFIPILSVTRVVSASTLSPLLHVSFSYYVGFSSISFLSRSAYKHRQLGRPLYRPLSHLEELVPYFVELALHYRRQLL